MIVYRELESIEKDLGFSAKTLYALSNSLKRHYRYVLVPKSDGSKRQLSVPDTILKRVQRAIADNILSLFPVSQYATAYKKGATLQQNAYPHIGKAKILKLDIEGFFDNILYSRVKDLVFTKECFSEPIRILLSMLCYNQDALPQGAPSSPAITNILMYGFDEKIGAYCKKKGLTYTRYCDDMTFSGEFDDKKVIAYVARELRKLGFFLKNRKTVTVPNSKRQTVTGIVVNQKINLPKDYKKKLRQEIYYIKKFGLASHCDRLAIEDPQKYLRSLQGKIAYVLQVLRFDKEFCAYRDFIKTLL